MARNTLQVPLRELGFGCAVLGMDLFRTRMGTATDERLREEVLRLRWPGPCQRRLLFLHSP